VEVDRMPINSDRNPLLIPHEEKKMKAVQNHYQKQKKRKKKERM